MRYGLVFLALGAMCIVQAYLAAGWWCRGLWSNCGICFMLLGGAYLKFGPRTFLKRSNGRLSLLSYLLFWPYHLMNWLGLLVISRFGGENRSDEIVTNLHLGRRTTILDRMFLDGEDKGAVLDLTSEFARAPHLNSPHYLCLPLLDTFPPSSAELAAGTAFIASHIQHGPVYVHCAMGHGRSATFVAAYLLACGLARDADSAEELVRQKRRKIDLHPGQRAALSRFATSIGQASRGPTNL